MAHKPDGAFSSTQTALLDAAEALFAERGIAGVSNRQICEAAGQGNNYAIGYHFGSREGLLAALLRRHDAPIEAGRARMVAEIDDDADVRAWLRCAVQPQLEYFGTSTQRTHFAAFAAQMALTPDTTKILYEYVGVSENLTRIMEGFYASLPPLPDDALAMRTKMTNHLLINGFADFEETRNASQPLDTDSWRRHSDLMVDAIAGLWLAPSS